MMRVLPVVFAVLVLVVGCGGGGGNSFATLQYGTEWGTGGGTRSQLVRLFTLSDEQVGSAVLNEGAQSSWTFSNLGPGPYLLQVDLYSQANGQGTVIGRIKDRVQVSGTTTYLTTTVGAATRLEVHPSSATLKVGETIQLCAVALSSDNKSVFLAPGAITWESLNGNASVDGDGLVTAQAEGQGVIRASALTFQASSILQIEPNNAQTTKWTIMVFLNAANDLDSFSDLNVNQMERVANNPQVRFVVQWKRVQSLGYGAPWTGTRRYLIKYDPDSSNSWSGVRSQLIQNLGNGVDMGSAATLRSFVQWTMANYPAERYVLVLWNHGSGWRMTDDRYGTRGFSFDDEFFTNIETWQLGQALGGLDTIDIVSWDSSLMQMMEVAYEMPSNVQYMVGSEESPPAEGLPYDLVFGPLRDNPNLTTEQLGEKFGQGMLAFYGETRKITQSMVRLSDRQAVADACNALAQLLIQKNQGGTFDAEIQAARNEAQAYSPSQTRWYRDLWHLAFKLKEKINDAQIDAACDNVMAAVEQFVVHNAHNSLSPNSHGISIEFGNRNQTYWNTYGLLSFAQATQWDDFCRNAP
ncbi:MAG: hypothetical protein KatS3mg015_0788 [Fimbriimonadales bacterium]|nr:MAG: hypothetical protein KatS3mg015_0788 [Fimbriimonadales bacterium]